MQRLVIPAVVLSISVLSGCGGGGGPGPLSAEEARTVISQEAGYRVGCLPIEGIDPELLDDHGEVWECNGGGKKATCWEIRFEDDGTPYTIDPKIEGTNAIGYVVPDCPEYGDELDEPAGQVPSAAGPDPSGPEGDLATIELGSRPSSDNTTLALISTLLDTIESDCPTNTRTELADFTANAYRELNDAGLSPTPVQILQDVSMSTDLGAFADCLDVFVQYVLLRKGGG